MELALLRYRKYFHLTWQEMIDTPWEIVATDMQIIGIESEVIQSIQEQKTKQYGKTKRR